MALYTDRAHWAFHTPKAKGPVDKTRLTQVGRALARLGIEHIPSYSPQARGRSERLNRTFQDRLVNELRVAGSPRSTAANRYLLDASCRSTTRRSRGRRGIRPAPSSRSGPSIWTPSCVMRKHASSRATTPSVSSARCCNSPRSPVGAAASGCTSRCVDIWMGTTRFARGPQRLGHVHARPDDLWTRPRRWTPAKSGGRPHGAWSAGPDRGGRQAPTGQLCEKRSDHLSKRSGQITCQQQSDMAMTVNPLALRNWVCRLNVAVALDTLLRAQPLEPPRLSLQR